MHLGNSIICPVTGIPMIIAMGVTAVWAYKKSKLNFTKEKFLNAAEHVKKNNSALHLFGLVSTGGVHSSLEHILALIKNSAP